MYRVSEINQRSITFDKHVIMWLKTNRDLRQIRYIASKTSIISIVIITLLKKLNLSFTILSITFSIKTSTFSLIFFFFFIDDLMNLSSIMIAIKNQFLKIEEIRKISENWKLCFYCKLQHLSRLVTDYFNKKINLRSMKLQNSEIDHKKSLVSAHNRVQRLFLLIFSCLIINFSFFLRSNTRFFAIFALKLFESNKTFKDNHVIVTCILRLSRFRIRTYNLINCDAFDFSFIDEKFAQTY
jgi:hypothetical protein